MRTPSKQLNIINYLTTRNFPSKGLKEGPMVAMIQMTNARGEVYLRLMHKQTCLDVAIWTTVRFPNAS